MVGHDHVGMKAVAITVEMFQSAGDNFGNTGFSQPAVTFPGIKVGIDLQGFRVFETSFLFRGNTALSSNNLLLHASLVFLTSRGRLPAVAVPTKDEVLKDAHAE